MGFLGMVFLIFCRTTVYSPDSSISVCVRERVLDIRVRSGETVSAKAVLLPVVDGEFPRVLSQADGAGRFGKVATAFGIKVVPLTVIPEPGRSARVTVELPHGISPSLAKSPWARLLFPYLFTGEVFDLTEEGAGYLIIVPDDFYTSILPFARWKTLKGFTVWVKKISEIGTGWEEIRDYIRNAYETWTPKVTYVLLVGAINKIPACPTPGATSNVTDHPYSTVDGADYLADLFVGRLPAANLSELDCMVAKLINYESNPYTADTLWFHRALMVGTSRNPESGTPAVTALVTKRRIREQLLEHGFITVDTVFDPPTSEGRGPVDTAVNRGVLLINGRGWGNAQGWGYPQYSINDVYGLSNGWMLPVITSIYCGTGNFRANPCFGEAWLRAGTPNEPKGAVAFWGSSYSGTSTRWNNCMDYGIYRALLEQGINVIGPAMYCGKLEQLANFPLPADSQDLIIYFHVYNLLGDPSMEMWTGVPREITVAYPGTYPVGEVLFPVYVSDVFGQPIPNARVCVYKPGEVHSIVLTDSSGCARFFIRSTTPDTLFVTVTGKGLKPHLGYSLGVTRPVFVGHYTHSPETVAPGWISSVTVTLKNFGLSATAPGVYAVLSALDSFAVVRDSVKSYGDIGPGQAVSADAFVVEVAPRCTSGQRLPFLLRVVSGDSVWRSGFFLRVEGPTLKFINYRVHDENGVLDPGDSAEITVRLVNRGAGGAGSLTCILRSSNPNAIAVLDSAGYFGTVVPGEEKENTGDRFLVRVAPTVAVGHRFFMFLVFRGEDGFEQTGGFPITVGTPAANAPLGPDRYGYWAYDDTDTGYAEAPRFNWVEIDPGQGGAGTHLPLGNDQALPVSLPFTFRFYGREFRTISVADNGLIALDSTDYSDIYNWHIPSAQGPDNGLLAVFWDDFRADTLGAPGVFYYYDEGNHRVIVEWSRVYHVHGFRTPYIGEQQTFQAILGDPAYYPTVTGDAPIIFQYLSVQNDDTLFGNSHNYATVGIQSPGHTTGVEWTFAGSYPPAAAEVVPGRAIKFTTNPPDTFTFLSEREKGFKTQAGFEVRPALVRDCALFRLSGVEDGSIEVFDALGRTVYRLPLFREGEKRFLRWNLEDQNGNRVGSGVYIVRLTGKSATGRISIGRRVVVLK